MSDPLFNHALLRLAADAHGHGVLAEAGLHGEARNPACGDRVEFDLRLADGRIAALAQRSQACVLTQASASLLAQAACGHTREEIEALKNHVAAMLARRAEAPPAPFDGYAVFSAVAEVPGRHVCVTLPFEALLRAFAAPGDPGNRR